MDVTNLKTKLAKRVYLIICIYNIILLFLTMFQYYNTTANHQLREFVYNYLTHLTFIVVVTFVLLAISPEWDDFGLLYMAPLWTIFIFTMTLLLSRILLLWDYMVEFYVLMTLHHLAITIVVFWMQRFDSRIVIINIIISVVGILAFYGVFAIKHSGQ